MPRIAITGQKGGVGKTAIGLNLSAALAEDKCISFNALAQFMEEKKTQYAKLISSLLPDLPSQLRALAELVEPEKANESVLVIDLDPQGHLTEGCGVKGLYTKSGPNLHRALLEGKIHAGDLVQTIPHEKFFLMPAHMEMLTETEKALQNERARERKLKILLKDLGDAFTWELIDCPPFLGNLTDNAIFATGQTTPQDGNKPKSGIIIPVLADKQSIRSMELLMDQVQTIEEQLEIFVERLAIVPNVMTDSTFERGLIESVRASLSITLPFEIRKRVVVKEAYNAGRSIFTYEHKDKKEEIYETRNMYRLLAFDLRQRCNHV